MFHIMVAEDDINTSKLLGMLLRHEGYTVFEARNGEEALKLMDAQHIDLIVLDIMMPRMDGYEFTRQLRECGNNTPILMLTAKQLPEDLCKGFNVGTDDYMTKPFNEQELLLRIKALLRRAQIASERQLRIGKLLLDYDSLSAEYDGVVQALPQKEFLLLYKLLSYPNRIFTRLQIMDEIWGMDSESYDTTINVHIARLRKRFENCDEFDLVAIRGVGYKAVTKK